MIIVIDFGGQYAQLISRRVRDLGVYSEVRPYDISALELGKIPGLKGVIFSGGPSSVYEKGAPRTDEKILSLGLPVLGLCYGHQLIALQSGGNVRSSSKKEYGSQQFLTKRQGILLKGFCGQEDVWMSHGDVVAGVAEGFEVLGSTQFSDVAAYENNDRKLFGVQFHPEVTHTRNGAKVLENFLSDICNCQKDWNIGDLPKKLTQEIRELVGDSEVIMATSGGVDSTVAAKLIHDAIGDRIHCVLVDHGLMRLNEAEEVTVMFKKNFSFGNFHHVDASELFLSRLKGVKDPEEKRKIIGHSFIEVFEAEVEKITQESGKKSRIGFLGQGTIYPDRIESAQPSKAASKIKSHHNLTLPDKMKLGLVEPLKDLYKDEVRRLGLELGISREMLFRHPFPGPGLAIRILGDITEEKIRMEQQADKIVEEEIRKAGYYDKVWQAFAVLLDSKSVGVMGDGRTYEYVCAVRSVDSTDVMTADWTRLPHDVLDRISRRIVNEVDGINRVVYDITSKPPATICYE